MSRPRAAALTALAVLLTTVAVLLVPTAASARRAPRGCPGADEIPRPGATAGARRATLCLLNRERGRRGMRPLRSNARLRRAAVRHSRHMKRAGFFAHTTPTGTSLSSRVLRAGYARSHKRYTLGENIAWGAGGRATARAIVRAWMRSAPHRANILNPRFREVGIGVAAGAPVPSRGGATYTTDFGLRH